MHVHSEGGMSMPDLQALIDTRIPEHRNQLETSHKNLADVANHCEAAYINSNGSAKALAETKQFAIQSLASVAYQINTMARDLLDMLELQTEKVGALTNQVYLVNQVVDIHKEKLARREIGALTTNKTILKQPKIVAPAVQEPKTRYVRTPIDYSVLDGVGHGVRTVEPLRNTLISRASSTVSTSTPPSQHYGSNDSAHQYGVYGERTATLGRSAMRQGYASSIVPSDYRVPQVTPMSDQHRINRQISHGSDLNDRSSAGGSGSHHGSNDYSMYAPDRYGTIRASNMGGRNNLLPSIDGNSASLNTTRLSSAPSSNGGGESPTFPLPPPQLSHYGGYVAPGSVLQQHQPDKYGTIRANPVHRSELPPPPRALLQQSMHEDMDDLPPPPESVSGASAYGVFGIGNDSASSANLFDISAEWVPNGEYLEKSVVLYDYEAEKADELTLRENAIVYVLRKNEDGWFEGVLDGVTGLFPGNYVQPFK